MDNKVDVITSWSTAGTHTFTVPEGVTEITVEISGAGAGGRGRNYNNSGSSGSAGEGSGGEGN
jgi:hypothetical protein